MGAEHLHRTLRSEMRPCGLTGLRLQRFEFGFAARRQDRDFAPSLVRNDHSQRLAVALEQ
jgi:hypothetical protein